MIMKCVHLNVVFLIYEIKKNSKTPTEELIKTQSNPLRKRLFKLIIPVKVTIAFRIQLIKIKNRIPNNPKMEKLKNLIL